MSLDDRLRQGLRTLEAPESDSARELQRFRTTAYPRRARRRVMQGVIGTIAAVAIAFGISSLFLSGSLGARGFVSGQPKGVPTCTPADLHVLTAYGTGPVELASFGYASNTQPCWIDQSITLAITGNGFDDLSQARKFGVFRNNFPIRLRGVVPAPSADARTLSGLGVTWEWTNWCGNARHAYYVFSVTGKPLRTADDILRQDPAPSTPQCVDPSKQSALQAGAAVTSFKSTLQNDLPLVLQPAPGLAGVQAVAIEGVYVIDGRTLWAVFTEPPCFALDHAVASESSQGVTLFVYLGRQSKTTCHPTSLPNVAAKIVLSRTLGGRGVVDGSSGHPVAVAH